jgi:hypothetical protein
MVKDVSAFGTEDGTTLATTVVAVIAHDFKASAVALHGCFSSPEIFLGTIGPTRTPGDDRR